MSHDAGMIVLWSGTILDIPAGWGLCDGTLGTPDLRDRFLLGAGGFFAPGATGGASVHDHTFTGDGHFHNLHSGDPIQTGNGRSDLTTTNPATGTTDETNHFPPYYALAYIMRL